MISKLLFSFANRFFSRLPLSVNYLLAIINFSPVFVYGFKYRRYKEQLNLGQSFDFVELLNRVLFFADSTVPYYRVNSIEKLRSIQQFKTDFDLIDKEVVQKNFDAFIKKCRTGFDTVTTAGTTGKPMRVILPRNRYVVEYATLHHHWGKVGYRFHLRAVLRNHKFTNDEKQCRLNPVTKELVFNNFDNSSQNYYYMYKIMKRYRIQYLHAYPSGAYQFFTFLKNQSLDLPKLKVVLMSSENILEYQRELIEGYFEKKVFGFYGHSEKLVFAGNCPHSDLYHVDLSYGFFELLDERGNDVRSKGEIGEIVGSSYHNPVMPLMRYRTGDYAEYYGDECPHCNYKGIVLSKILGRWNGEKVYNKDGTFVTTTALNLHSNLYEKIDGLQYRHTKSGVLEVLIIPNGGYCDDTERKLLMHFKAAFKDDMEIHIKKVQQLVMQHNGKFLLLLKS